MLTYNLDRSCKESLYVQLYRAIRFDIESGTLSAGYRLPSKRMLAEHLGLSVITVENAYKQLVAEGYVFSRQRSGYYVEHIPEIARHKASAKVEARDVAEERQRRVATSPDGLDVSASQGTISYAHWARSIREALAMSTEQDVLAASSAQGYLGLREALVRYLRGFRGIEADASQVVIGAGSQTLYQMLIQLLGREHRYAIETPGYRRLPQIYSCNDVRLCYAKLDEEGVRVDDLVRHGADIVHCMPSHQYPSGIVMGARRRYELLQWAAEEPNRYIIEDDYDCEFRMKGKPIPPLQSVDPSESVIYTNTFTKSLGSAFRIAYMILPPHLVERFQERLGFYSNTVSALDQIALARFIATGAYERHVNRLRARHRRTLTAFVEGLRASAAGPRFRFEGVGDGLHFLMTVDGVDTEAYRACALEAGIALTPLSDYFLDRSHGHSDDEARYVVDLSLLAMSDVDGIVRRLCDIGTG